jgi:ABC-type tungstate transport system substrate-binding protein
MTEFWKKITKQDIRNTLAVAWTVLCFVFMFRLMNHEIPPGNKDVINAVAGVLIGQNVVIIAYFFVQSKSEIDKTKSDVEDH